MYAQNGNPLSLLNQINEFKKALNGKDPNVLLQELLSSGKVTQEQYEDAKRKAEMLKGLF